ncbi:alpha/beta hydrolase [Dactylosporangium sp. NPDC049140]|uniref:alpha/beta hydrolase n=1 Tax=Dactylosporangium sp. NPDC049140 TaxID=3155647 RepID=UPI0033FE3074
MPLHMIVLPGGGYEHHATHEAEPVAEWLGSLGLEAGVLRYPVATRHPGPLLAVQAEIAGLRRRGVRRIGVIGFSAGGHLAGHAALAPDVRPDGRPDLAVLCYPVVSMLPEHHAGSREQLLGADAPAAQRREASLEELVTPQAPPFFLWHSSDDKVVPVEHSYRLARALAAHDVPHELHVFPHGRHGLGLAEDDESAGQWTRLCARWLAGVGAAAPAAQGTAGAR